jgi:MFS family permease
VTDTTTTPEAPAAPQSAWAPLRRTGFRSVWSALLGSQIVNWAHTVGAVTVIASLSGGATLIALVQTANSLPAVLLALLAGASADILDRRRLVLAVQAWMVAAAATLSVLTLTDVITSAAVLALTFALGAGTATTVLAYQALTPDVIGRRELPGAVTLNGVAINLARAVGPALAGFLIGASSAGALFGVEAGVLLLIMTVVFHLRPPARVRAAVPEQLIGAMRAGARFVRFSSPVRSVLVRAGLFSLCASGLWALLPVVAFGPLDLGSRGLGLLFGCVGAGAIAGAAVLPQIRPRVSLDLLIALASLALALGLLALAYIRNEYVIAVALLFTGGAWLTVLSSLNTSAQQVAPGWVRARTLATFQLVFQGGLALGSLTWGLVAGGAGVRTALLIAAGGLVAGIAGAPRWRLAPLYRADVSPAASWSEPRLEVEPAPTDGPVLVTLEYRVDDHRAADFVGAMEALGRIRRRDGAYRWDLYQDLQRPGHYVETFLVDSWQEHLRQQERFTVADLEVLRRTRELSHPDGPEVRHMLWAPAALAARARATGYEETPRP